MFDLVENTSMLTSLEVVVDIFDSLTLKSHPLQPTVADLFG